MASVYVYREVITALMRRYRYNGADVASRAQISASAFRSIVNGHRSTVEPETAKAIARVLRVSVSAISSYDVPPEMSTR